MDSFVLHIAEEGANFKLIWTIYESEDTWMPDAYLVDARLLQQAANAVRAQLQAIAFPPSNRNQADFSSLLNNLWRLGHVLFLRLMPDSTTEKPEIQQRLEQVAESPRADRPDLKVRLTTEKLFVPWGFVFPGSKDQLPNTPSVSFADLKGFWLSQFSISIVYGGSRSLPSERKASFCKLLALHEDMFVLAKASLGEKCLARLNELLEGKMPATTDWDSFEDAWNKVSVDNDTVLYVFGHSDGTKILLNEAGKDPKYELSAADLIRFRKRAQGSASFFILNGCRTAAPISTDGPISANFLKETRQPGYYGFIGTEFEVSNTFACRYGIEFLWRLCKEGKSVGEALDELLECDDLFPQNILYTCYADRRFRFASVSGSETQQ